jgi:arylsulfatase A-like enzyme
VSEVDHWIGEILAALEASGQADNTLIVYTADHGDFVGHHGMVEKCACGHNVYEDTLRVPLIVAGPGCRQGVVSQDLVGLVDLMPTLLLHSGCEVPRQCVGENLLPLLRQGRPLGRDFLVSENWVQSCVIGRRFKLARWLDERGRACGEMLFDRETDPLEITDVAGSAALEPVAAGLRAHLEAWERSVPDARYPRRGR